VLHHRPKLLRLPEIRPLPKILNPELLSLPEIHCPELLRLPVRLRFPVRLCRPKLPPQAAGSPSSPPDLADSPWY